MLVKYVANRRPGDGSVNLRVRSTGKVIKLNTVGEVSEDEFRTLSSIAVLEVVEGTPDAPKELDDMNMTELKEVAELENVHVEDKRSKDGYLKAIREAREQAAGEGLPATAATGSPSDAGSPSGNVGNSAPAGDGGGTVV